MRLNCQLLTYYCTSKNIDNITQNKTIGANFSKQQVANKINKLQKLISLTFILRAVLVVVVLVVFIVGGDDERVEEWPYSGAHPFIPEIHGLPPSR